MSSHFLFDFNILCIVLFDASDTVATPSKYKYFGFERVHIRLINDVWRNRPNVCIYICKNYNEHQMWRNDNGQYEEREKELKLSVEKWTGKKEGNAHIRVFASWKDRKTTRAELIRCWSMANARCICLNSTAVCYACLCFVCLCVCVYD